MLKTVKFSHYEAIELIHESDRTLIYRGQNLDDGQPVVIKLMRNEYPSFSELVQFRNQYTITKNLAIEGIVKTIALERYQNRYGLIMEVFEGISLTDYRPTTLSFSFTQFLAIAIQLAEILHQLHQKCIIHKDIKPANILINPSTQQIKLIDFSISTLLPKETQTIQPPNVLEGTLAYLAPEQTGRMNRGIDYRSDFYSLGVTFYELLTGNLPFDRTDPFALVHAHIAQEATPVSNWIGLEGKFCPEPLSNIVMKLMAKNAEDRYQSSLGLKYDLEQCLSQYRKTDKIEPFVLGERDICDRFNIPEKLYGREKEVQTLLDAFDRIATGRVEMILVAGFSGIGKTAVISEVHKPITRQKGYFIQGKFDQFNRNIPFSAFVQAFRSLIGQLLGESDVTLATWKAKILDAIGSNGQVILEVLPELQHIIGEQTNVPELSGSAAQNRFNLLFGKFLRVFATQEHPLAIFLDDLQWADSASLNLLKLLMRESESLYLLVLGAYRDNEVFPTHPLMLTLDEIEKQGAQLNTLTLSPLGKAEINHLVADTLLCSSEIAAPLSQLTYQKTQGNPFFTTQFLQGLYEDRCIVFDIDMGYWQCDLAQVRQLAITNDVVEFMVGRLQKLPESTQDVLKLAACIGNHFDLETLATICDRGETEIATDLWRSLQEGLVIPESEIYKFFQGGDFDLENTKNMTFAYRFLHDRVQQAAYSLIPENHKQATHLKIGRQLLDCTPSEHIENKIFDIVNQINLGSELITQLSEKFQLAKLNFIAGKKAKIATAYAAAFTYAEITRCLLPKNHWQKEYEFTLSVFELSSETAYLTGNFAIAEDLIAIIFHHAQNIFDKIKTGELKIQIFIGKNQILEAIEIGLEFLSMLGIDLPKNPSKPDIDRALLELDTKLSCYSIESLISLPISTHKKQLASMRILSGLLNAAYVGLPNLLPIIIAKQVDLSITYGNMDVSPSAYANYGLMLCSIVKDLDLGYQFGNLALNLLHQIDSKEFYAKTIEIVCLGVKHWQEHINSTLELLLEAYQVGLESGDFESASFAACDYCVHSFFVGKNLVELERTMFDYSTAIDGLQQKIVFNLNELNRQTILNLIEEKDNPSLLKGKAYDETKMLPFYEQKNDLNALALLYINKLLLCYLFGDSFQATKIGHQVESYLERIPGQVFIPIFYLYDALSWTSHYSNLKKKEKNKAIERISSHQVRMRKWADSAAMNYTHKLQLITAEKCRVLGQKLQAIDFYDLAIARAKENGYIQEEALANELAAKFYLDWGKEKIARTYLIDAYYCYAQWGAKAKVKDLKKRYPELIAPLQKWQTPPVTTKITESHKSQTATLSVLMDLSSVLKASQTLSKEIELDRLLSTLMKVILENAGATKGALLLPNEKDLAIAILATYSDNHENINIDMRKRSLPLEEIKDLPIGLIRYVHRTSETVLLDAKVAQTKFTTDAYLIDYSPKSLLCLPLFLRVKSSQKNESKLVGILYLENNITSKAFTPKRIEILDILCTQASISLENTRLYQEAKQTQLQLIQNEKMATLGNLVAGVAHEINNPLSFISGNVTIIKNYLADLFAIIEGYRQEYQNPSPQLAEDIAELDFWLEDFPKLIASMQSGCDRIADISTSLRTFSRTDMDKKTEFNLHEGIDSTLLILKYRLKANEQRPAIEIIKNYGDIPEVKCYAGQINQVFMNILANAIDAFEESNQGKTYEEIEKNPNTIAIQTTIAENQVQIQIKDNGCGMKPETRAQIFEQGFTTKEVGKGTGLGMAIARQIIEEKHDGAIACHSQLGQGTEFTISLPMS